MSAFHPALIIVDLQEDFCPPSGSLAVPDARAILPIVDALLALPFPVKIATRDFHPADHVSFARQHPGAAPFTSSHTITHPTTGASYTTTLWPPHCVAGTPGAQLVLDPVPEGVRVVDKGRRADREMYSAFCDPFGESDSGLKDLLRGEAVTDVYVVGLTFDYCVRATAEHAAQLGFRTVVLGDATRAVFPDKWDEVVEALRGQGVDVVNSASPAVDKVRALSSQIQNAETATAIDKGIEQ
ncbi:Isochorismatase-like protein [Cordyceps fumosorosea ARSEF 2679]|uniref:nicotinamidase n=1 Tax=Cordyceps fumosorosea (strain ARSEF 2679) TaxID=1081104 RepID=A0A168CMB6_CORFA|nr:Isochorismatase-like protein [Cordyceps fumosorosea ARSEF 2679]OAA71553.1 Isochorismatase-like protein [Cordyceps fumosorosea ARSEF 2679]